MTTMSVPMWRPWPWDICVRCRGREGLSKWPVLVGLRAGELERWMAEAKDLAIGFDTNVSATRLDAHHSLIIYNVNYAPTSPRLPSPAVRTLCLF